MNSSLSAPTPKLAVPLKMRASAPSQFRRVAT